MKGHVVTKSELELGIDSTRDISKETEDSIMDGLDQFNDNDKDNG